jgi:hypothetical protein
MSDVIRVSTELCLLKGEGVEFLVDSQGVPLLKFIDGNIATIAGQKPCSCIVCEATRLLEAG